MQTNAKTARPGAERKRPDRKPKKQAPARKTGPQTAQQTIPYEQIKELISVDTLKTMQLLGFNYKAAIGEPLTQICADAISNMCSKNKTNTPTQKKR